ncbi:MAG TPA: ATP-binding protein, partial [Candidatus Binatia bacterium]|nr:ATP-binding protein [Candidatus Binatia bacterium]
MEKALNGERQLVFVTGEPGIGKTSVVDAFLHQLSTEKALWVGRGQCVEYYGAGEAYLPVLEALGRVCRAAGGERLVALLSRHASTWLAQMPGLLSDGESEALQRKVSGVTHERMLREFAEMIEAVSAEQPLVLALEDLQWSDYSTLDLLTVVAQRREAARVLVLGTYRPADAIVSGHPLRAVKQELQAHRQCEELALGVLNEAAVAEYLARRFPGSALPPRLARGIHRRTEGNPLFMVNVIEYLATQGLVREVQGHWQLQA